MIRLASTFSFQRFLAFFSKGNAVRSPFEVKLASIVFSSKRPDYYRYLAELLVATKGSKSLVDIFLADVDRYKNSARGVLCAHWAQQFKNSGGSLVQTFQGTLPAGDVAVLRATQEGGGSSFDGALRDLADNAELMAKAKAIMAGLMITSLFTLATTLSIVIMIPSFTLPKIIENFDMMPVDHYPPSAKSLISFAGYIGDYWLILILGGSALLALIVWSLSNLVGRFRPAFDKYGLVWGLYRDFQSIQFMSLLAAMIRKRGNETVSLQFAIGAQLFGASRWKRYHLTKMLGMMTEHGDYSSAIFGTGIMSKQAHWYVADLIESRGMENGLQYVRQRLEENVLKKIRIQGIVLSWSLMILSLVVSGGLMLWHVQVVDDIRRAMTLYLT